MRLLKFHKRLTCLTLMALAVGAVAAAETKTEGFDNFNVVYVSGSYTLTLPDGWDYNGPMTYFEKGTDSGTYKKAKPSIGVEAANSDSYIVTPMLQGEFSFWLRDNPKSKAASVKAYTCTMADGELKLGEEIGSRTLASGNTTFYEIKFTNPTATRVALLISQAYFDDFTYTPAVPIEGPSLVITDYANGSNFDFGTVSKGTEQRFTLTNKGNQTLEIESITISGGYDMVANATPLSIESGKQEDVVIATPDKDTSGVLTIISNDPESPYEINVSSNYKAPKPIMEVSTLSIDLGRVTADASGTFIVSNTGDATLTATLTSDNTAFVVNKPSLNVEPGQSEEVTVMYKYEATAYGVNKANITIIPNEGEQAVVAVSVKVPNPNVWSEDFSENTLPEGWEIQNNNIWTFTDGYAQGKFSSNKGYLNTPSLAVESVDDEMTFQYRTTYTGTVYIKIQYSKDGGEYKDYKTITEKSQVKDFKDYTISGLTPGNYCFRFENDDYDLDNFEGFKLNQNAPKMEVTPLGDVNFGKVIAQPDPKTFTVANAGTGKLTVNISSSNADFSVEPAELIDIDNESAATFTVNFNYDVENLGEKSAVITVTPTYNKDASVSFSVYANAKDPNIWEEDFEEGVIPEGWSNSGWKVEKSSLTTGNGTYMAYAGTDKNTTLTTPRLYAAQGQKLAFEVGKYTDKDDPLTVEYSHDKNEWILLDGGPITSGGVKEFTAPEDGYYYLRFQGRYGRVDNFNGFKLSPKAHDLSITGNNIPTVGNQFVEYTATVTLQEMMGVNETVTATLYFGTEQMVTVSETLEPNAIVTLDLTFLPTEGVDNVEAFIKIIYAENESLETEPVAVTIEVAPVWDENAQAELAEGTLPVVVFNYVPAQGWNSIGVPFALDDDYLALIFGPSFTVYELNGYENNTIVFREAVKYNGKYAAGYPYIVYVNSDSLEEPVTSYSDDQTSLIILRDVKIEKTEPQSETKNGVTISANFSPRDVGVDETLYEIDATAPSMKEIRTVKGYRSTITLDAGITSVPSVVFYDNSGGQTGIVTIEEDTTLKEIIFNLNGQRVQEPVSPGIYIINGKKTIVK